MTTARRDSTAHEIFRYSSGHVYARTLGLFNAFIKPKLLSPELFGLWNLVSLFSSYATYSDLGVRVAMRYRIPQHLARGEENCIQQVEGSAYRGSLCLRVVLVAGILITAALMDLDRKVRVGMVTIAIVVFVQWYHGYTISLLKSYQQFRLITHDKYLRATVTAVVGAVSMYFFNIYGAYATAVLAFIIPLAYLGRAYPIHKPTLFSLGLFADLVRMGVPIMVFDLIFVLVGSADRLIVASLLGTTQLGYYGIASMVFAALMQFPGAAREVIEPRLMQCVAGTDHTRGIEEYVLQPLINTAVLMPFLIGPAVLLLPVVIPLLLPRYIPGILPTQIVVVGSYFVALAYGVRGIIVARGRQARAALTMTLSLGLNVVLSAGLVWAGFGLPGVAAGSAVAYGTLFASLLWFIQREDSADKEGWRGIMLGLVAPFGFMALGLLVAGFFTRRTGLAPVPAAAIALTGYTGVMLLATRLLSQRYPHLRALGISRWLKR